MPISAYLAALHLKRRATLTEFFHAYDHHRCHAALNGVPFHQPRQQCSGSTRSGLVASPQRKLSRKLPAFTPRLAHCSADGDPRRCAHAGRTRTAEAPVFGRLERERGFARPSFVPRCTIRTSRLSLMRRPTPSPSAWLSSAYFSLASAQTTTRPPPLPRPDSSAGGDADTL